VSSAKGTVETLRIRGSFKSIFNVSSAKGTVETVDTNFALILKDFNVSSAKGTVETA
jgi:hypothetical protein